MTTRQSFVRAACVLMAVALLTSGCRRQPTEAAQTSTPAAAAPGGYPARPQVEPPPFQVFHSDASTVTLATSPDANDAQIAAIIWQLHDAARAHSFDTLGISQKLVDARAPIIWFHVYRGTQCADEKYIEGPPPCGGSYHGAGDYTLGGFTQPNRDAGSIYRSDGKEIPLWNPDASTAEGN